MTLLIENLQAFMESATLAHHATIIVQLEYQDLVKMR